MERNSESLRSNKRSFDEIVALCDASAEPAARLLKEATLWLQENVRVQLQPFLVYPKSGLEYQFLRFSDGEFQGEGLSFGYRTTTRYGSPSHYYVGIEGRLADDPSYSEAVRCQEADFLASLKAFAGKAFQSGTN